MSCYNCGGRGYTITCPDDMCHGQDECIHGDGETYCSACEGTGGPEDDFDEDPAPAQPREDKGA